MAREKLDFVLPASLKLRKEIEDLPGRVDRERREYDVRNVVDDLNAEKTHEYVTFCFFSAYLCCLLTDTYVLYFFLYTGCP